MQNPSLGKQSQFAKVRRARVSISQVPVHANVPPEGVEGAAHKDDQPGSKTEK
jgi:hypothetical protein